MSTHNGRPAAGDALGGFFRAWRARLRPDDLGIPARDAAGCQARAARRSPRSPG
ncbi:hypothetical protein ACH46L_07350 [Streptomyces althioticus]|uniref:hypothetical protein n=1 Tax=Streptomyces althioticus TaxID=83380 RepID=UPI0036AC1CF7